MKSSSGKPVARRKAQTMARSSSLALQGSLGGRDERSWQSAGPRLRHLRIVAVDTLWRLARVPALLRVGNLGTDRWGGAGIRVDGKHKRALREEKPAQPVKDQACSAIAQRA